MNHLLQRRKVETQEWHHISLKWVILSANCVLCVSRSSCLPPQDQVAVVAEGQYATFANMADGIKAISCGVVSATTKSELLVRCETQTPRPTAAPITSRVMMQHAIARKTRGVFPRSFSLGRSSRLIRRRRTKPMRSVCALSSS